MIPNFTRIRNCTQFECKNEITKSLEKCNAIHLSKQFLTWLIEEIKVGDIYFLSV